MRPIRAVFLLALLLLACVVFSDAKTSKTTILEIDDCYLVFINYETSDSLNFEIKEIVVNVYTQDRKEYLWYNRCNNDTNLPAELNINEHNWYLNLPIVSFLIHKGYRIKSIYNNF